MALTFKPYGQVEVSITPLLGEDGTLGSPAVFPIQFADLRVTHPLNDGRTAQVTLSMYDNLTETLAPWQQALRILYYRPLSDEPECIFWGQCNVEDDYTAGTVTLTGKDPSERMTHHYLSIGDDALNDERDYMAGRIFVDHRGLGQLVDAAQAPNGPVLGLAIANQTMVERTRRLHVERGQSCWQLVQDICETAVGPDIDVRPAQDTDEEVYAYLDAYEKMEGDKTGMITLEFGQGGDNLTELRVTPQRPGNHIRVTDRDRHYRIRAVAEDSRDLVGVFQDFTASDWKVKGDDTNALEEYATARARAYGVPPLQVEVTLRASDEQEWYYGHPDYVGDVLGDFYVGDVVLFAATRGYRTYEDDVRITEVEISTEGWRSPVFTKLTVIPRAAEDLEPLIDVDDT